MSYNALLVCISVAVIAHSCFPAVIVPDEETEPNEENTPPLLLLQHDEDNASKESSSPEDSHSYERIDIDKSYSSESKEGSSSAELDQEKLVHKRSVDAEQDAINEIDIGQPSSRNSSAPKASDHNDEETDHSDFNGNEEKKVESSTDQHPTEITTDPSSTVPFEVNMETTEGTETTSVSNPETTEDIQPTTENDQTTTDESKGEFTQETKPEVEATEGTKPETEATEETKSDTEATEQAEKDTEPTEPNTDLSTNPQGEPTTEAEFVASTTEPSKNSSSEDSDNVEEVSSASEPSDSVSPNPEENVVNEGNSLIARVHRLSEQIRLVLLHYRNKSEVVIPGQNFFPDPMPLQNFAQSMSVGTINFMNMHVHGLSDFTVEHVNTDVDRMQVYILLKMKKLVILGDYTLRTFWSRAAGPFNVTLLDVDSEGVAEVSTAPEGHLEATDSVMDMATTDMLVDFKNLGFMGMAFQSAVGTVGNAIFDAIKPQILERVNVVIRTDVNKKLKEFSTKFINKVNPVDKAFSEGRKFVRSQGYDPYSVKDHNFILGGLVYVNITEFSVEGLSRFYRMGNLSISMDNGTIEIGIHAVTEVLTGHCIWSGQTFGIVKYGKTNFTVDHLQVKALIKQSLDIRKKPQLDDIDLELGKIKVSMDSPMTLNMMIEGIINAFPRLIRHIIVDALEEPLKEKIQEILNKINVESVVDEHLPRLDSFGL